MKKCSFCAEEIQDDAVVCKHCGRDLKKKLFTRLSENVAIISTLIAVMSAAAALYSAYNANRSADTAGDALRHSQEIEQRRLQHDVITTAQNVIVEAMQVDDMVEKLNLGRRTSAQLAGRSGAVQVKEATEKVEKRRREIALFRKEVQAYLGKNAAGASSTESLGGTLAKFNGYLIHIRGFREMLSHELAANERALEQKGALGYK